VWLAAVAFVSPQVGALVDNLHNEHNYCATHDDFVHGDMPVDHEVLALRAPGKDASKTHTHCETWKTGLRPAETFEKAPERKPAKTSHKETVDEAPIVVPNQPVYAYAPKTSPPSHV